MIILKNEKTKESNLLKMSLRILNGAEMWVNRSPRHQLSSNHHITNPLPCHYLKKHNKVHSRTKVMTIFNYNCNKLSLTTQVINQHWHSYVLG
jgi:hypothetical protein